MKIYFNKYKISEFNHRFSIEDLDGKIISDNKGLGFKTKNRAYNVIKFNIVKKLFECP